MKAVQFYMKAVQSLLKSRIAQSENLQGHSERNLCSKAKVNLGHRNNVHRMVHVDLPLLFY